MQAERRSQAPWIDDPSAWGRIRLTRQTWAVLYPAVKTYMEVMWKLHNGFPNPSPESRRTLEQIRELQKVLRNLEQLGGEKGWLDEDQ
jgi:hypothetical protein